MSKELKDESFELGKREALRNPEPIIEESKVSCIVVCPGCGNDKLYRFGLKSKIVRMRATRYKRIIEDNELKKPSEITLDEDSAEPWEGWDLWFICTKCGTFLEDYDILTLG